MADWRFESVEELAVALEEFTSFHDSMKIAGYEVDPVQGGGGGDSLVATHDSVMRKNAAINRAMVRLRHLHFLSYRLLDYFYRQGACCRATGWGDTCRKIGLPTIKKGLHHRATFEVLREAAVESLFVAHCMRPFDKK